ncbi:type VI secretion protein, partial [Novosphingobium sp. 1949]|nr:type VI secretion protein [Novosphingobium organovorum]
GPAGAPGAPGAAKGAPGANDDFAARIGGTNSTASAARTFDPATTVTQGTLIPAVLETAIDTEVPGYVRAIVSTDVRSFDGKKVLIPRSSRLIGQYKSGLTAGQKRAYVIWTRLIRPDGVSVDIGSPAIAFGGETGLAGKVNNHFFTRFGSAILLSVVDGLTTLASGGSSVVIGSGSSAASSAVQSTANVGPTIRVRQGQPIRVFTAKDLDFGSVQ